MKLLCELFIELFYLTFDETLGIIFHAKANQSKIQNSLTLLDTGNLSGLVILLLLLYHTH